MTSIIVAFPKPEDGKIIRNALVKNGFKVSMVCTSGAQTLQHMDDLQSGVLVCGYRFSDMIYAQILEGKPRGFEMLLIASPKYLSEAAGADLLTLAMPLKVNELISSTALLVEQQERQRRKKKTQPVQRTEEEKKAINDAKELLMERNHMEEREAHKYLQKVSMDSGTNMVEAAYMILRLMEV